MFMVITIIKKIEKCYEISLVIKELQTKFSTDYMVIGGDFILTPDEWIDRWPSRLSRVCRNPFIENFINNNKLLDIWRTLNKDVK